MRPLRALGRAAVVVAVWLLSRGEPRPEEEKPERIVPEGPSDRRAELLLAALLAGAGLCAIGFVVVYALDRLPAQTQLLGLALGLAFVLLAAATIVLARRLVAEEELVEDYGEPSHPEEQEAAARIPVESADSLTRRRLLTLAAGGAGVALGAALVAPALSLGPAFDPDVLRRTPWRAGRRLVDARGQPLIADRIETDTFYTAYPEGASRRDLGAPIVIVRLDPAALRLPPDRAGWAPGGIVAYSKICTHAACAVALYRTPLFEPTAPRAALVCPCHYSTFDPATGGTVLFGPAGRPLPQLPVTVDEEGGLRAAGGFSAAVGPSWWGVELE